MVSSSGRSGVGSSGRNWGASGRQVGSSGRSRAGSSGRRTSGLCKLGPISGSGFPVSSGRTLHVGYQGSMGGASKVRSIDSRAQAFRWRRLACYCTIVGCSPRVPGYGYGWGEAAQVLVAVGPSTRVCLLEGLRLNCSGLETEAR